MAMGHILDLYSQVTSLSILLVRSQWDFSVEILHCIVTTLRCSLLPVPTLAVKSPIKGLQVQHAP